MNNFIKVKLRDKRIEAVKERLLKDPNYFSEGDLVLMTMHNQSILNDKLDKLLEVKDEKLRTELPSPTRKEEEND